MVNIYKFFASSKYVWGYFKKNVNNLFSVRNYVEKSGGLL